MVVKVVSPGLDRALRRMHDMPDDVDKMFPVQAMSPLRSAANEAKGLAPVRSGRLQRSIVYGVSNDGPALVSDNSIAPHNWIVHNGGAHPVWGRDPEIKVEPTPFISAAVEKVSDQFEKAAIDTAQYAAKKAGFKR